LTLTERGISHFAHHATERIHLAHKVSPGNSANRRIAAHLRNQVEVQSAEQNRTEQGLETLARQGAWSKAC
jgi:hypothetical protein